MKPAPLAGAVGFGQLYQRRSYPELYGYRRYRYFSLALSGMAHRFTPPYRDGISFTFLSLAASIAAAHGMGTLIGAVIIGGLVEGYTRTFCQVLDQTDSSCSSRYGGYSHWFFTSSCGCQFFCRRSGCCSFGSMNNWIWFYLYHLVACLLCQIFTGFLRSLSVLVGLIVGYILACFMGMIDYSGLTNLSIIALPRILPFTQSLI